MRVLAFTPQFLPVMGGIEVFADALIRCLHQDRVETTIVTEPDRDRSLPGHEVLGGIPVYRVAFSGGLLRGPQSSLRLLDQFTGFVAELKPDLLHMHSASQPSGWFIERLIRKLSPALPLFVTQHGLLEDIDRIGVVRSLMNSADVLTAVSQAALHSAIEFSGRSAATVVIPNGLEPIATQPRPDRYGPPFGLLCVGRLVHGKGFDLAIEALATIRAAGVDAHLTIVGQGEERERLDDLVRRLGLDVYVHFTGVTQRRETLAAIAQTALVLVPSRATEGFSLVAAEAALSGVPCVAARVGGLADTVEDGVTGVIVNPESGGDLAAAVVSLLKDERKMRELAANARRISPEKFDMRKCAAAYLRLFHEIVDRRRA